MLFLTLIYFLTRLFFLRPYPVFYDSFEYVRLIEKVRWNNVVSVVNSSHQPIHTLYLITAFIFKSVFFFLPVSAVLVIISLLFGYLALIYWYQFLKLITNKKIAFYSALFILVFPYYFVANTNILYESELLFLQILSLYFLAKKRTIMAGLLFGAAQLVFIGNLLLIPICLLLILLKFRDKLNSLFFFTSSFFLTSLVGDLMVLGSYKTLITKYTLHLFDLVSAKQGVVMTVLRIARNIIIQASSILSVPGAIFLILALMIVLIRNRKKLIFYMICLLPVIILMQYWHAGFYGRLAIFIIFPASFIIVKSVKNTKFLIAMIVVASLTTMIYALSQRQKPPIYLYYDLIKKEKNEVVITSDYNRFLYEKNNLSIFVIKGNTDRLSIDKFIQDSLKNSKTVLIDSAALNYPYFQYDGSFYQILSQNKTGAPLIKPIMGKYQVMKYKIDKSNKEIYFIILYNSYYAIN